MGIKKNEVQHFKDTPEIQHFPVEKVSKGDNAYGIEWANLVRKFLETAYSEENPQVEIVSDGVTYKVLRREKVTAFYDADGNTIFDVENKRLEKEYGYLMKETAVSESAASAEAVAENAEMVYMGTASLADIVTGNVPAPTVEEIAAAEKVAEVSAGDVKAKAISKLDSEFLSLKKESDKKFAEPCIDYLKKRCEEDSAICEDILQEHKTWRKCYDYVYGQAKKELNNTSGPVWHETVFEWVEDYFHLDDKAIEEQKAKEVAEHKKKQEEAAKKAKAKQKSAKKENRPNTKKTENKTAEKPAPKKRTKEMEGQMDLFSMMGL